MLFPVIQILLLSGTSQMPDYQIIQMRNEAPEVVKVGDDFFVRVYYMCPFWIIDLKLNITNATNIQTKAALPILLEHPGDKELLVLIPFKALNLGRGNCGIIITGKSKKSKTYTTYKGVTIVNLKIQGS